MLSIITPYDLITNPVIIGLIGIASLAIGIVGVILAIRFYRKGKILKRLTYDIISDTPVVSIKRQVRRGNIKIEYEDNSGHTEEISDARLLTLKIWNSGNTDIKIWNSNDTDIEPLEEPIEFEFDKRTVVDLTDVTTEPPDGVILQKDLDTYLNISLLSLNHLGLPRCLLKQKQTIELTVLLTGGGTKVKRKGKIINGEIGNLYDTIHERLRVEIIKTLAMMTSVFSLVLIGILLLRPWLHPDSIDYLLFTTLSAIILWGWMLYRITHPFKCGCGFETRFTNRFKRHVLETHHQLYFL